MGKGDYDNFENFKGLNGNVWANPTASLPKPWIENARVSDGLDQ